MCSSCLCSPVYSSQLANEEQGWKYNGSCSGQLNAAKNPRPIAFFGISRVNAHAFVNPDWNPDFIDPD